MSIRLTQAFQHVHDPYSVLSDFVELSALAISNAVDKGQYEARKECYLDIVRKYAREELERFARMRAALTMSLELRQVLQAARQGDHSARLLDHGIVADVDTTSFAERRLL